MPKHIVSGLKYLTAVELRKRGLCQREIAQELEMDRSTVSHYLNGRNLSWNSIEIAQVITELCPRDFLLLTNSLVKDTEKTRTIVNICQTTHYQAVVKETCIGCGMCVDLCLMKAVILDDLKAQIDSNWCCGCLICMERCPTKSIEILEVNNDRKHERSPG
ncbi:4Fe-4S dicluster domain-containing protein [Methanobacterium alcaliphilum]|uniref:4Fe-4S dicluster domain-containing protein n=1 Tax=Methanobacterium alcaliphilum TaxID=392018 RepID=UPI002009F5E6|nr:4Fe-4S dicluster domain-containing protein [Methanobacterium alcaliphilum]MCK9151971.1 ArsR family transcriptional regulator [Methanobacterium alcaliphilum]